MSTPSTTTSPEGSLQFERAERAGAPSGPVCTMCQQPIAASYYEVNGTVACQRCRTQILAQWNRGSAAGRFGRALGLGLAAAAVGAGLYFGIEALTGYEFGLVAIIVGLLVGGAVRRGSNGRGGWRYQVLAMFLTYTAVVITDSSMIARELSKEMRARRDSVVAAGETSAAATVTPAGITARPESAGADQFGQPGMRAVAVGIAVLAVLAFAAPIVIGIASPLHLVIAGFALYEAWKLNKGAALQITGPYQVAPRAATA